MVSVYKPPGLDGNQFSLLEPLIWEYDQSHGNHANHYDSSVRRIFVNTDPSKVHFGYVNLSKYLNFRKNKIDGFPKPAVGDLLVVDTLPVDAYFLDVRYCLYRENISNYNANNSNRFSLYPGFCEPGSEDVIFNSEPGASYDHARLIQSDIHNMSDAVNKCQCPNRIWDMAGSAQEFCYTLPVRSWCWVDPLYYDKSHADFVFRIHEISGDINAAWQMHIWYSYVVPA